MSGDDLSKRMEDSKAERDKRIVDVLNRHGLPFQHAVTRHVVELCVQDWKHWKFLVSEFPVEASGKSARVDIVFEAPDSPYWIIAECKRVNPAFSHWCFFRSSYLAQGERADYIVESAHYYADGLRCLRCHHCL